MEENIYFISGHLNLSRGEFQKHHEDKILEAMKLNCKFVTSDSRGYDTYAQELFANHKIHKRRYLPHVRFTSSKHRKFCDCWWFKNR
jgi:hypothetical protein